MGLYNRINYLKKSQRFEFWIAKPLCKGRYRIRAYLSSKSTNTDACKHFHNFLIQTVMLCLPCGSMAELSPVNQKNGGSSPPQPTKICISMLFNIYVFSKLFYWEIQEVHRHL